MSCQTDNNTGEVRVHPILNRSFKNKSDIDLHESHPSSCLCHANEFRVYSQLSLPIWPLSADTLC